jgi:hypothetical protein
MTRWNAMRTLSLRARARRGRDRRADAGSGGRRARRTALLLVGLAVGAITACGAPAARLKARAASLGFETAVVTGIGFEHRVFWRRGTPDGTLHIYLDGDGLPWRQGRPSRDPTPRNPLVLDLMALDPAPVAYIGRPCYDGQVSAPGCTSRLWTAERYSEAVVGSLEAAARHVVARGGYQRLRWFGYSGGGALVMLLAPRVAETVGVVTVAANLDTEAWTTLHGYTPLAGSLNPASAPPLAAGVSQRHYAGGRDRIVPPGVVARGPIPAGSLTVVAEYDHTCCWKALWPSVLREVSDAPPAVRIPGARRRSPRLRDRRT